MMTNEKYTELVNLYADTLFRIAFTYCSNKEDAEDVVQNTFLKLYNSKKDFDSSTHIKNWLIKVTVNNCKHLYKSPWKSRIALLEEYDELNLFCFDKYSEQSELFNAVMQLPEKLRVTIHLYYYEDYSVKRIAKLLSVSESAVQNRLMRGREKLKSVLREDIYE